MTYVGKRSRMSATLLSNYMLTVTLMKNIALKYGDHPTFERDFESSLDELQRLEGILYSLHG